MSASPRLAHLAHSLGREPGCWLALVLLAACMARVLAAGYSQPVRPLIVFLGAAPMAEDRVFDRFMKAMERPPRRCPQARFLHLLAEVGDDQPLLTRSVAQALSYHPRLIVAPTASSASSVHHAAPMQPLIYASYQDPVALELHGPEAVRSVPVTGVSLDDTLDAKRLDLLREAFPHIRRVGVVVDKSWLQAHGGTAWVLGEQARTGLALTPVSAETPEELGVKLTRFAAAGPAVDAWYIPPSFVAYEGEDLLIRWLAGQKKPAIHATVQEVRKGALMAYSADGSFSYSALADLADRICQGEPPQEIPVERPRRYELSVRGHYDLGGRTIAPAVLARADRVEF